MIINSYAAYKAKEQLKPFQYDKKQLNPYEVFVEITHCGICHSDIHLIDNDWMISRYPLVPGHEIIGNVKELGSEVKHLKLGDRVGIGWQSGSCHNCEQCNTGQENLCSQNVATAVGRFGGFAEYIITDSRFAFSIPEGLDSENAAPLLCGGITVYSPLRLHNVKPNHKVGVIGIGGLGHLAIQFANAFGCEVTAFSTSASKEKEAIDFGAKYFINSKDESGMKKLISKFDYIITTATGALNWNLFLSLLKPNGRLNFVGATVGNLTIPPGLLVGGQKTISGTAIGGRPMIQEMLEFANRHNIVAKTELAKMEDVNNAIERVRNNQARYRMVLSK